MPAPDADAPHDGLAVDLRRAVEAVEAELGGPQSFFEVTATPQLTNVFVAIDDATAAVPYVFVDGELEAPAPTLDGVRGTRSLPPRSTFDETFLLGRIADELPTATIESVSVEGGPDGTAVRYVVSRRRPTRAVLDIVVGARRGDPQRRPVTSARRRAGAVVSGTGGVTPGWYGGGDMSNWGSSKKRTPASRSGSSKGSQVASAPDGIRQVRDLEIELEVDVEVEGVVGSRARRHAARRAGLAADAGERRDARRGRRP